MAPLKSLEQEYPLIDSSFQAFCASHGIFSVEDLILHDIDVLIAFADKQSTSLRLKQGINQLLSIIDALHQQLLNGLDLLEDAKRNKHVLSTGCQGIDALLGGGLREGQLTELVGPSSSGKTQVCLKSASTVAKKHMSSVVYLDTSNSFSPQRIAHFVGHALMISAGFLLKKLAHEHNLAVLVTNHMVGGDSGTSKPALGESWKSVPHVRLLLSRDWQSNICNFSILKHPSMASGKAASCTFCDR